MSDAVVVQFYSEEYFLGTEQFLQIHPSNISIHSKEKTETDIQAMDCELWWYDGEIRKDDGMGHNTMDTRVSTE